MTGKVKGFEVKKNRNGTQNVLMLQCEISGPEDLQSVEYMSNAGDNTIPVIGSTVAILIAGPSWKIAVAVSDGSEFDNSLVEGDRLLYSKDRAAIYKIGADGKHYFNDGSIEAARNGDAVQVTIPALTFIVSVSGGSGSPAVGVLNPDPIDVDGTIQEGTNEVLFP